MDEPFDWIGLGSLTNHNHFIDCVFPSPDNPSVLNCPAAASYNASLVGGIVTYINDGITSLSDCFLFIFYLGGGLSISLSCSDFIGSITPILDICIGGIINFVIIE